jgi:hypothetical protein
VVPSLQIFWLKTSVLLLATNILKQINANFLFFMFANLNCRYNKLCTRMQWTAGIVQTLQPLSTGWTVRGSNPGEGEIFRARSDRPQGPPSLLYNWYRIFPTEGWRGYSGRDVVLIIHPPCDAWLCEWVGAIPPPPLCICTSMSRGDLYSYTGRPVSKFKGSQMGKRQTVKLCSIYKQSS